MCKHVWTRERGSGCVQRWGADHLPGTNLGLYGCSPTEQQGDSISTLHGGAAAQRATAGAVRAVGEIGLHEPRSPSPGLSGREGVIYALCVCFLICKMVKR